jgi:hypothetical protein
MKSLRFPFYQLEQNRLAATDVQETHSSCQFLSDPNKLTKMSSSKDTTLQIEQICTYVEIRLNKKSQTLMTYKSEGM